MFRLSAIVVNWVAMENVIVCIIVIDAFDVVVVVVVDVMAVVDGIETIVYGVLIVVSVVITVDGKLIMMLV